MNLPRIIVTDENGNLIPFDQLPSAVRDRALSGAAERIKQNEALKEPTNLELAMLMSKLGDYAIDSRPSDDRGPSPLTEELTKAIKSLVLVRAVHREIIKRIVTDSNDPLPEQDEKASFAVWVRDETIINNAIDILKHAID